MQRYPLLLEFNRFVEGRPNPINIPVSPTNEIGCIDHAAGANIQLELRSLDLWTYTPNYPPRMELDCASLSVDNSIKLGDVEKLLPEGVYLHKKYLHRKYQAVLKLEATRVFKARRMVAQKKKEDFEAKKKEIELADAMKKNKGGKKSPKKRTSKPKLLS